MSVSPDDVLKIQLQRKFTVKHGTGESSKRVVSLIGPIILIEDPEKINPELVCYLPEWIVDYHERDNHGTIILFPQNVAGAETIHIKTKKRNHLVSLSLF